MFSQVCVRSQGGIPVPGSFPGLWSRVLPGEGVPQSQVLTQVSGPFPGGRYPRPGQAGTPIPAGGVHQDRGTSLARTGLGYPQLGLGYPLPWPGLECPLAGTGVPQDRTGVSPPPRLNIVLATQWSVCLFWPRRRTFLFIFHFMRIYILPARHSRENVY